MFSSTVRVACTWLQCNVRVCAPMPPKRPKRRPGPKQLHRGNSESLVALAQARQAARNAAPGSWHVCSRCDRPRKIPAADHATRKRKCFCGLNTIVGAWRCYRLIPRGDDAAERFRDLRDRYHALQEDQSTANDVHLEYPGRSWYTANRQHALA